MYPIVLICLSPLSGYHSASFPHELLLSGYPPVPNPILESQLEQTSSLLLMIPILALGWSRKSETALKPSLLHLSCKEASEPISNFHVSRPSEVLRCCPSAIREYKELAVMLMTTNLICWPNFIPRQIFEKVVFQ